MTDPTETKNPSIEGLVERLRALDAALPAGPWELWTSCSFRRITGPDGKDGGVLSAYLQRSDNHPDLSMPEHQLQALVDLRNAAPEAASDLARLQVENALLRGQVRLAVDGAQPLWSGEVAELKAEVERLSSLVREAEIGLGQIARMKMFPDYQINNTTLVAAFTIARATLSSIKGE